MKILVTGAAGFIGSNLVEYFLNKGYLVTGLDNFSTGKRSNISSFVNLDSFEFIEGDIRDLNTCRKAVENCEYVLHQAALGSVPRSIKDPITSNEVNVGGFLNMLVACKDAKVKKMIYAASSSTYGDSKELPKIEDQIGKPLSPYAVTKYVNELYADVFYKTYGLNTIGLRYFNVFGRRQDPESTYAAVIPIFTKQLKNKKSPTINGDGSFSRDFTYIDNVVQANELAMLTSNPRAENAIFNIACGAQTTLNQLVELLKYNLSKFDPKIANIAVNHASERIGDIPHSLAAIDKARQLLGYEPSHTITDGIEEAVKWYWDNL